MQRPNPATQATVETAAARLAATGGAGEALPLLTDTDWACRCTCVAERDELIDYAHSKGVRTWRHIGNVEYTLDLGMTLRGQLIDYDGVRPLLGWTTPAQFRAMCDAYAAR